MNINSLKNRLRSDRPTSVVQVRMPDDVIDDLQRIAPKMGIPDYRALICHYVGKGLREDVERFEHTPIDDLIESLKRHGVSEAIIDEAVNDMAQRGKDWSYDAADILRHPQAAFMVDALSEQNNRAL